MSETHDKMLDRLVLGRYRILRLLAQGGMGTVYLARVEGAAGFAKPVVVKLILPHLSGSTDDKAQFIREAQILSNLRHPGIVNVIDFGKLDDAYLMVLEYIHGYHLGQWLKYVTRTRGKMPWDVSVLVLLDVLAALHHAHSFTRSDGSRAGIIHRDISPGNILIDVDGSVRLADFGIARIEAEQTEQNRQSEMSFKGKFPYAAPELFAYENASTSTDIYACGVVLYQLLAGTNPFSGQDANAIIRRVLTLVPPTIGSVRDDVPTEIDQVLQRVLAKDPGQRYASANEFAAALRALLVEPEAEVRTKTLAMIRTDFTGELPRILDCQSLEEREAAWRKVVQIASLSRISLSSQPPTVRPPKFGGPRTQTEETVAAVVAIVDSSDKPRDEPRDEPRDKPRDKPRDEPRDEPRDSFNHRLVAAVVVSALVAAAAATAAAIALRGRTQTSEPRYLVVESHKQTEIEQVAANSATASTESNRAGGAAPVSITTASTKQVRVDAKPRDAGSNLSLALAKRQAAIQGCFLANTTSVSGAPELSIRFSIDTQGKVTSAAVRPDSVAATSLGQCLRQVAQSTEFGPQEKPLVFSIPLTARAR